MRPEFLPLIDVLKSKHISGYFQQPNQLVLSRQIGPAWPDRGNSFWICHLEGNWLICTWAPRYYRVANPNKLLPFCEAFVDFGSHAQGAISEPFLSKFGLTEIPDDEFDKLWAVDQAPK